MSDLGRRLDLRGPAGRRDLAAAFSRAGPEIDQVIGSLDDLAVVLDEHQRVAQVAQVLECSEQAGVIARVQPDRRLVEHVENAGQPAADLAGQADPLALTAGKRRRATGQAQVIEADVDQERQAVAHLAKQVARDVLLVGVERQFLEESQSLAQRPAADLVERESLEPHGRGIVAQPASHAAGTGHLVDHPLKLVAVDERNAAGFLEGREQALVLEGKPAGDATRRCGESARDRCRARYHVSPAPWRMSPPAAAIEIVERGIEIDSLGSGQRLDHLREKRNCREIGPDGDGALAQAQSPVGHEHCRVGTLLHAQSLADRAPSQGLLNEK